MIKLCECGCGQPAPISTFTDASRGYVKGQAVRFVRGHNKHSFVPGHTLTLRHGGARQGKLTPEYSAFHSARARCTNPRRKEWPRYGGRGIQFLFTSFEQFIATLGARPSGMTLDRVNNDGDYDPGNVRWATRSEQRQNQRAQKRVA